MSAVRIYTKRLCVYCFAAKNLLVRNRVEFEEVPVDGDPRMLDDLAAQTGYRLVPQIFIHGRFIGGFDQLNALVRSRELDALLDSGEQE